MSARKRKPGRPPSATRDGCTSTVGARLAQLRRDLRLTIAELKALDCEDSMLVVEFWHALDSVTDD